MAPSRPGQAFGTVWLGIFLLILGLLQLTLVESSVPATTAAGRLAAFFIFVPVMILAKRSFEQHESTSRCALRC